MKSLNEINYDVLVEAVDEFLEPFGCDSDYDNDFFYDKSENTVYFSIIVSERADRLFKEYVKKTFHFSTPNVFMMSLLHEVGHAYTLGNFSRTALKTDMDAKAMLEDALSMKDDDELFSMYFDLEVEKAATAWAVDYYKANTERCEQFYAKFLKILKNELIKIGLSF